MVPVTVTLQVKGRAVPADKIADKAVAAGLRRLGIEVGSKLKGLACPTHNKGPSQVRVHVSATGEADIQYEACCDELRKLVGSRLG